MVADINATGASSTPIVINNDTKANNNTESSSFADALAQSVAQNTQNDQDTKSTQNTQSNKQSTQDSKNNTQNNANNTQESNTESKANTAPTNVENNANKADSKTQDSKDSKNTKDTKDSKLPESKPLDSKALSTIDSKAANIEPSALSKALNKEEISTNLQGDNLNELAQNLATDAPQDEIKDSNVAKTTESSVPKEAPKSLSKKELKAQKEQEIAEKLKTLSDVKKEAQARNLNLQKMEVVEQGKRVPINPADLMDAQMLDALNDNKNRLANSLQQKGQNIANNIANAANNANPATALAANIANAKEMSEKDKLLAELLNRYDAAENAKRKAINEAEKLRFKVNDGDKSVVIERNTFQPRNIVNSNIRNEAMQQNFLEKLHEITGDEGLAETIEQNQARLEVMLEYAKKAAATKELPKGVSGAQAQNLQGWAKQGEFVTENSEMGLPKDVTFEIDGNKPFDNMLQEKMKADSTAKSAEGANNLKKSDEKSSEKAADSNATQAKQDIAAAQAKQDVAMKNALAREMIKNFAGQFRDEVQNYKPPITKLNLELNPANLGEVSMSIAKKGKDLQVSITTNANVMTMFVQNAQELRQNLMQIGFNNLDLNFSARDNNQKGDSNQNSGDNNAEDSKLQSIDEAQSALSANADSIPSSLEITLPEYA